MKNRVVYNSCFQTQKPFLKNFRIFGNVCSSMNALKLYNSADNINSSIRVELNILRFSCTIFAKKKTVHTQIIFFSWKMFPRF